MRLPAPSAAVAAALLLGASARAQGVEPAPPRGSGDIPGEPPPAEPKDDRSWVDESHRFLERELAGLTARVDGFFGDEGLFAEERAGSFVRVRTELRLAEDRAYATRVRVLGSVELPSLQRWLSSSRLVVSAENQPPPSPSPSEDPASPALAPTYAPSFRAEQASLELRLDLYQEAPTVIDVGAGVRLRLPLQSFVRSRYRRRLGPILGASGLFTQSAFWTGPEGFGESTELRLDRPVASHTLLRGSGAAVLSEVSPGLAWTGEGGVVQEILSIQTTAFLALAANGHTRPVPATDLIRVYLRLRRPVWKRWLFAEVEPEIGFPLVAEPDGQVSRRRVLAITFRLEVQVDARGPEPMPAVSP